jgi:hypothetical protein
MMSFTMQTATREKMIWAIIFAASILCGLAISADAYTRWLLFLVGSAAIAMALTIHARHFLVGLSALLIAGVSLPIEFHVASAVSLNSAILIAAFCVGSWLLMLLVFPDRYRLDLSRPAIACIALILCSAISFLAGQYPWFPSPAAPLAAQLGGLSLFLLSGGIFLAVGHQLRSLAQLKGLTWLFLGLGGIFCISQSFPGMSILAPWSIPDSVGSIFWIWFVAVGCSQALFNTELSRAGRMTLYCLTAIALYRGLFLAASWASGWLPPLVAITVIVAFRFRRTAIGLCTLAIPVGLLIVGSATKLLMSHEQYSYLTRLEAWKVLFQLVWKSPILGLGPANYYYYTVLYPIFGWYVRFNSHNNYMDLLAQTGVLGFSAFVWFIAEITRMTLRYWRKRPVGFARAYTIGVVGGLAGSLASGMLADWIIPFFYNIGFRGFRSSFLFWFFLGGMLSLSGMTRSVGRGLPSTGELLRHDRRS